MWPDPQFPADLVIYTEKVLDGKLSFLCNDELLFLKAFVEKTLPDCNVCISNLILRTDNAKASRTLVI